MLTPRLGDGEGLSAALDTAERQIARQSATIHELQEEVTKLGRGSGAGGAGGLRVEESEAFTGSFLRERKIADELQKEVTRLKVPCVFRCIF